MRWLVVGLLGLMFVSAQAPTPQPAATAELRSPTGESIATATLSQASDQVLISIAFRNRTSLVGTHAIQIHAVAQCSPPDFASAGPILNPTNRQHGLQNPDGPMAGDLPNLVIGPAGVAIYNLAAPAVSLRMGTPTSLLDGRGTSLVIFSQPDDDKTQPEGMAGTRIACGPIVANGAVVPGAASGGGLDLFGTALIVVLGGLLIAGGVMLRRGA